MRKDSVVKSKVLNILASHTALWCLFVIMTICFTLASCQGKHHEVLIEAESYKNKGGWVVDPQFVEQMGSPYLLAHGLGTPVKNAHTEIQFPSKGKFHVWVRTKNWVPGDWMWFWRKMSQLVGLGYNSVVY